MCFCTRNHQTTPSWSLLVSSHHKATYKYQLFSQVLSSPYLPYLMFHNLDIERLCTSLRLSKMAGTGHMSFPSASEVKSTQTLPPWPVIFALFPLRPSWTLLKIPLLVMICSLVRSSKYLHQSRMFLSYFPRMGRLRYKYSSAYEHFCFSSS
jgi:hypothetical protein